MPKHPIYAALLLLGCALLVYAEEEDGPLHDIAYYDELEAKGMMPDFKDEEEELADRKRSNQDHCRLCSDCLKYNQNACKDLGGQICNAYSGGGTAIAPHGFDTNMIANVTITGRPSTNFFVARLVKCFVANPVCPFAHSVIEIQYPANPLCRDTQPRIGDYRIIAFSSIFGDFTATGPSTYRAKTSTCYFNSLVNDLSSYQYHLLTDGPTSTINVVQACKPLTITEIHRFDATSQYIELYNRSPLDQINVGNVAFYQDNTLEFTVPNSYPIGPQSFMIFTNDYAKYGSINPLNTFDWTSLAGSSSFALATDTSTVHEFAIVDGYSGQTIDTVIEYTSGTEKFPIPTSGTEGLYLDNLFENNQIQLPGTPQYNYIDNDDGHNWSLCGPLSYATSTCTPNAINPGGLDFPFGKRDVSRGTFTFHCLLQNGHSGKYARDFCSAHEFRETRAAILELVPGALFSTLRVNASEVISKFSAADVLVLGDPVVGTLNHDDLEQIHRFVYKHGGTVIANLNSDGKGSLPLADRLLGSKNWFASKDLQSCDSEPAHMQIAQEAFVARAIKKVEAFDNSCYQGFSCSGGVWLAQDPSITANARVTLCFAEVGLGQLLFVTGWKALQGGLINAADNKQLLLNFLEAVLAY